MSPTTFEHNKIAYGHNIRGFDAHVPDAFGLNRVQMKRYYEEVYTHGPNPQIPLSPASIAGAAAYKAVFIIQPSFDYVNYSHEVNRIADVAAREALFLLQQFPLPNVDPKVVSISAAAGAHRLYNQHCQHLCFEEKILRNMEGPIESIHFTSKF
ncbi:17293_t:CDS:2 [Acaulospora morrowiae]|uniref:17293_t:CDS:1 n=1 Tax=Acaulospora morrowiae TaxID=94023 RepID=A0A9N9D193_9GLOM|nr:17293_t:CDS:2 [Acaulospora morrowiae]